MSRRSESNGDEDSQTPLHRRHDEITENTVNLAVLVEKVDRLSDRVKTIEDENEEMRTMTNRWKGGAAALVLMGTIFGAILAQLDHIRTFLGWKIG